MTVRNVDSVVLLELAGAMRNARGELESRFNTARNRVESAPGGWERAPWEGIPSFIRMELEALDRDQRELIDRAVKVDLAAAVRDLPEALPTSALKFLLSILSGPNGFAFYMAGGAIGGLVATVAAFTKEFTDKNGRAPQLGDFARLKLNLDDKTAGSSGQMKPARQLLSDGTYGSRYTGKLLVNGKVLTDAEVYERAKGIERAYKDKLGRPPTDAEYDEAMRSGKSVDEIRDSLSSNAATAAALKLARSSSYPDAVKKLYGTLQPYPSLKQADGSFITPTTVDCVTFAGAVYLAMGLPSNAIPGRGGGLVNDDPDDWTEGWVEVETPSPGSNVRVGGSHSLVYLGAVKGGFVVAESNYPTGSGPRLVVINASGTVTGEWTPEMGQPADGRGKEAAAAIDLRYAGAPRFGTYQVR